MRKAADLLKIEINIRLQDLQRRKSGIAPLDIDEVTEVDKNLTGLLAVAEEYDLDSEEIRSNTDLTSQGKRKALEKLAQLSLQKIDAFEANQVTKPRSVLAQMSEKFLAKAAIQRPTDPFERDIYRDKLRHLWSMFAQADPLEVDLLAMTSTDPLVHDALATAPPVLRRPDKNSPQTLVPLVHEERIQAAASARAHMKDPETAAVMAKVERLTECYAGSIAGVKSAITEQVAAAAAQAQPVEMQTR